jgi:hypothetical protein
LTILRKGDESEREWWWARNIDGHEGYVPRNLLGVNINFFLIGIFQDNLTNMMLLFSLLSIYLFIIHAQLYPRIDPSMNQNYSE